MTRNIDTDAAFQAAQREAMALLDAGNPSEAVALADDCVPTGDQELHVTHLQAAMCTDGGLRLGKRELIERGMVLWQQLGPDAQPAIAYNLANAEMAIYELAAKQDELPAAFEQERHHLRSARTRFDRIGAEESAPRKLRLQALTNAANAYDNVGRYLDALDCYDRALVIDPNFGMALGNRGIALHSSAPFMGEHAPMVRHEAAVALDAALNNRDSVLRVGGPDALRHFQEVRRKIPSPTSPQSPGPPPSPWQDPHLDWCRQHELFLHVSHGCLREDTPRLDPIFFHSVVTGVDTYGEQRMRHLVDGLNAVKQEYVAARYIAWLASDKRSPIRDHAANISARVAFLDSLRYARWGVRTGMAPQAFAAATNVLDKTASFVHLYLGTARRARGVSFAALWHEKGKPMDGELVAALTKPERNIGLLALCDLSCDIEHRATPLSRHIGLRHTATHRFLVAHTELVPPSDDWFDRMRWGDLVDNTIAQLHIARAAIIYLTRLINRHEESRHGTGTTPAPKTVIPPVSIPPVDTRLLEYE